MTGGALQAETSSARDAKAILRALCLLGLTPQQARAALGDAAGDAPADAERQMRALADVGGPSAAALELEWDTWIAHVLVASGLRERDAAAAFLQVTAEELDQRLRSAEARLAEQPNRRVIILEDDWIVRRQIEDCCAGSDATVAHASGDAELTVMAARVFRPRLALIDLNIHGNEVAGEVAAHRVREAVPDTQVLLVTGYDGAETIASLIPEARALVKPLASQQLRAAIRAALD